MIPDQRHSSEPFACHDNLPFAENAVCFRRGSTSLVEMLRCRNHPLSKTSNPSSSLCPSHDATPANSTDQSVHATDPRLCKSLQNPSLLSPFLSRNQHFHHDSASHFHSPLLPLNVQPPSELRLSVPPSPQPHQHCRACMSRLLSDRIKGCSSLEHKHIHSFSTSSQFTSDSQPGSSTSPHLARSCPVSLTPPPLSNSQTTSLTSPARLSPPSHVVLPWTLYEGGELTLLNHCLHHIVSRRTSSPTLSTNHPVHIHREVGGTASTVSHVIGKRQSLNVPFLSSSPCLDTNLLLSPCDSGGRPDPLVG